MFTFGLTECLKETQKAIKEIKELFQDYRQEQGRRYKEQEVLFQDYRQEQATRNKQQEVKIATLTALVTSLTDTRSSSSSCQGGIRTGMSTNEVVITSPGLIEEITIDCVDKIIVPCMLMSDCKGLRLIQMSDWMIGDSYHSLNLVPVVEYIEKYKRRFYRGSANDRAQQILAIIRSQC